MRTTVCILFFALMGLQYKLWLGDGNLTQWKQLQRSLAIHETENILFAARNKALEADILELKSGDQALEERARFELGMIQRDEVFYQFIEKNKS